MTQTDVLVIDECSMLSKRLFESLDEVCKLKDQKHSFGDIQLVTLLNCHQFPTSYMEKKGAPVILLRNLSDKLVNGLRGHVYDIYEIGPVVEFPTLSIKVPLEKLRFSVFSPSRNTDVALRLQYPVKLSFAMSIHKSQGLTLESLEIDCRQIFKPGQLGVALGRARETKGLRVISFNAKQSVIPQPATVTNFLQKSSAGFEEDRSCCNNKQKRYMIKLFHLPKFIAQN
ncbi:ATP-dependent DNA helicase PIF1-like [Mercenaria mercenaria]|uniref:ATP-dependent DNA helicase PIF1-like n=1 Tax=Mercenaria mercenaria TaxID=6596 RepID=UPI00234F6712|nr:ATP-dependent DNA helicase PIF1-like [Mercenaria mercenaria]